jgi:bla regulator protein blaR1
MGLPRNLLLLPAACLVIAVLATQSPDVTDWRAAAGGKMAFEVASVKPALPGTFTLPNFLPDLGKAKPPGGHFRAILPLGWYISFAWKLDPGQSDAMYATLPKWANNPYLIEANADGNPTKDQMRLMMQSLLADRFRLRIHFETKEGPVFALAIVEPGKLGAKLIPHSEGLPCPDLFELPAMPDPSKPPQVAKPNAEWRLCGVSAKVRGTTDHTWIGSRDTPPWLIASDLYTYGSLTGELDKPVVDHTGLTGMFDWMLELPAGIISLIPKPPNPDDPPQGTPFLDAVRKQLGLKLERSRGDVRMFFIDHIEQPSEN